LIENGRNIMAEEKKEKKQKRPSAQKRELQHSRRSLRNRAFRSKTHTALRSLSDSSDNLSMVYSLLDKGVKKGVVKKNKADRLKSRLSKKMARSQGKSSSQK